MLGSVGTTTLISLDFHTGIYLSSKMFLRNSIALIIEEKAIIILLESLND